MINTTHITKITGSERNHRRAGIAMLACLGIAVCYAAGEQCVVEKDTDRCITNSSQAFCPGCTNFMYQPFKRICTNSASGSTACTDTVVACTKQWQVQTCYTPGTGPAPEKTTNYCANPGDWIYESNPTNTVTKSTENGVSCPTGG